VTETIPAFTALSEAEQRAVAERLLRIQESGWKPFWCPDSACTGDPHVLTHADGAIHFVSDDVISGPNGEPVGRYYETLTGSCKVIDPKKVTPDDKFLGFVLLEPTWAHNHARVDQRLPGWLKPWILFIMSGRGTGKTRTGVEFVTMCARKGLDGAIIGRRGTELINTHVAALVEHAHPEFRPEYMASKDILVWPNGATTFLFSAERPENIRSVNLSYFWMDEAAFMPEVETAWMNARLATRIEKPGNPIHILITSTPTSTPWVMKMEDDPDVEVRRVSTYANRANLSNDFLEALEKEYEGTRMGRQELHGEVLRDVEGALWNDEMFEHERVNAVEFQQLLDVMDDRVIAVDPAGSKGPRSDATGIIGVGAIHTDENDNPLPASRFFVLADATIKGSPTEWAAQVFRAARLLRANRIVAEKNFGGDMVKQTLQDYAKLNPLTARDENGEEYKIEVVQAVKSKETRAEPTVGKYEQGRVTHVTSPTAFGDLSEMEKEQVNWVPKSRGGKSPSPNRVDALVWAVRALESKVRYVAQQASSREALKKLKRRAAR
jgi:phage terminase large subunit-like protein